MIYLGVISFSSSCCDSLGTLNLCIDLSDENSMKIFHEKFPASPQILFLLHSLAALLLWPQWTCIKFSHYFIQVSYLVFYVFFLFFSVMYSGYFFLARIPLYLFFPELSAALKSIHWVLHFGFWIFFCVHTSCLGLFLLSLTWIRTHTKMTLFLKWGFACQILGGEFMARTTPDPIIRLRFHGPPEEGARWQVHARLGLLWGDLHSRAT